MTRLITSELLKILQAHPGIPTADLCQRLGGVNRSTLTRRLAALGGAVIGRGGSLMPCGVRYAGVMHLYLCTILMNPGADIRLGCWTVFSRLERRCCFTNLFSGRYGMPCKTGGLTDCLTL